ncbi:MAG: FMN-binding protein, partial [Christensenellales bacterium]
MTATVSVSDGKIDAVSLVGDKETRGIGSKAIELLPEQIVAAQSAEIDGIAGATVSSTAALSAVQAALDEAAGKDTATVKMAPGTYTIQKYGFQQIEPVTVTMTVDEDRILSVELDGNKDSVAMVRSVKNLLIPRIIANQSYAVDAITGATSTSNAVLTGVRDMLADALVAGGSDESALAAFESREAKSDISETVDVDVLVVGLGASGTAAVLAAAEAQQDAGQPVSVLGIDTAGRWGGTGAFTGSIMGVNAKGFKEKLNNGQDYMDGEDLYNTWLEYTEGDAKNEIIKKFLDNSGDTVDWLADEHGMLLNEPIAYFGSKWACVYDYVSRNTYKADRDYNDDYQGTEAIDGQNTMVDKYYQ